MAKLVWDAAGDKRWETGVDQCALYVMGGNGQYGAGVAWNGITAITDSPSGAESNPFYADNIKYADLRSAEESGGTIEAYTYPDEWKACNGSNEISDGVSFNQQSRATFGLVYRTKVGNDISNELGYKLHIVYGATASPSEQNHQTVNDSPELDTFSWEYTTNPVNANITVNGVAVPMKPLSTIEIDSTKVTQAKWEAFEAIVYGDGTNDARLPLPAEVYTHFTTT